MTTPLPRPWRLAAVIYGLSLLTLLVAAAAVALFMWASRPQHALPHIFEHFVRDIAAHGPVRADMQAAADRIAEHLGDEVALFDTHNTLVVASPNSSLEPLSTPAAAALPRGEQFVRDPDDSPHNHGPVVAIRVDDPGKFTGYGLVRPHNGPPPISPLIPAAFALVLVILGIAAAIVARRLHGPLARLLTTAQAFGNGDLRVRADLPPRGPLGALGGVFDEMAGRVARLLQAQRELLTNVSHELRTPLSRLRVALEIAADSDGPDVRADLHAAEEDLAQLEHMVEDVLKVASLDLAALQPEGQQQPSRHDRLDLAALAERTTRRFAVACADRPVDVAAPAHPLWIDADAVLVRRALDNLLDNARKYSDPTAPISVHVTSTATDAVVTVVDAGVGIDPADQPHVFTPFFRADRSRARVTGGVGLGLTLVQRIAVAHGGSVALTSAPGRGTTISLSFPRSDTKPVHDPQPAQPAPLA